jgi:hypothetical protein
MATSLAKTGRLIRHGMPRSIPDLMRFAMYALLHKLQLMNVKNCKIFQARRGLQVPEG